MKKFLICILILCLAAGTASASGVTITPLEEMVKESADVYYHVPLSASGRMFQMPVDAR